MAGALLFQPAGSGTLTLTRHKEAADFPVPGCLMTRLAVSLAAAGATLMLAAPALAADFSNDAGDDMGGGLRSGFSDDWGNSDDGDPLSFELGLRYWYSWGAQSFNVAASPPA